MADNRTSAQKMAPTNSPAQPYDAQQNAILQASQRQQQAEQRAAEAAFRAASRRPGGANDIGNVDPIPGLKVQYTGLPGTSGSNVKSRKKG